MITFKQLQEKLSDKEYKEVDALLNRDTLLRGNLIKNYTQRGKFETMKARDTFRRIKKNEDGKLRIDRGTEKKIKVNRHTVSKNFPELSKKPVEKYKKYYRLPEGVASLALKGGSKLIPALITGIGAAGTILQAKRGRPEGGAAKRYKTRSDKNVNKPKRKLSAAEKKLFGMQKKDTIQKGSDNFETKGLIKRGDKFTKQTTRGTSKNSDAGYTTTPEPTIEKPPTFTGRVDPTKGAPTPKRTTFKKQTKLTPENQFEDAAPTNSMGGGAIAGSVEAGDNPPVKKKKRYIYGGAGSRKMWMNNK